MMMEISSIVCFAHWLGLATPPTRTEKITIRSVQDRYDLHVEPSDQKGQVPNELIQRFEDALHSSGVPSLEPSRFREHRDFIESHYQGMWTDDHPDLFAVVTFHDGEEFMIHTQAQHTYMLPIEVKNRRTGVVYQTYDPELSIAWANLMPDGFMEKSRLSGKGGMLDYEIEREKREVQNREAESTEPNQGVSEPVSVDALLQTLFGIGQPLTSADLENPSEALLDFCEEDEVLELLAAGADPNVSDENGQTALMSAMSFGPFQPRAFHALIAAGADLKAKRNDGMNGFHLACCSGGSRHVAEWIKAGADLNARTDEGSTPIMLAAHWPDSLAQLLEHGDLVNDRDQDGDSALAYVIHHQSATGSADDIRSLQLLLDARANPRQLNNEGKNAIDHAKYQLRLANLDLERVELCFGKETKHRSDYLIEKANHASLIIKMLEEHR